MNKFKFLLHFLKDRNIASIMPTSESAVRKVCSVINFNRNLTVIEYGPGDGVFCRYLLGKMNKKSKLIAIETNAELAHNLANQIQDPRFFIENDSAENIGTVLKKHRLSSANYIISGIPFSFFDPEKKDRIINNTYKNLGENGQFLVYQYSKHVLPYLKKQFPAVHSRLILANLPPMQFMQAYKTG